MTALSTRSLSRRSDRSNSPWHHVDLLFLFTLAAISVIGVVVVLAATHGPRTTTNDTYFMVRQGMFVLLGATVMFIVASIDYRKYAEWWAPIYGLGLVSLLAVSLFGTEAKGAQRGFEMAGFMAQPSEFVKVAIIIALAGFLAMDPTNHDWRRTAAALGLVGVPVLMIVMQPDLGTAMVFGAITLAMLLVAGIPGRQMAALLAMAIVGGVLLVTSPVLEDYQRERLTTFINPDSDAEARYNTEQSQIAIANGGITGQGLLRGGQTANGYVPAQETDFIFTAVGEELGFIGASLVLSLYGFLLWRILRAAQLARDTFGTLICVGVFALLLFQLFENVGMTMGIMPVTGIPLPFMSYGGSSIMMAFVMAGLVLNVHMRRFS
ncbi:MAG: rod shape-determining protein RodA [Acidimicrobiales bacterium]